MGFRGNKLLVTAIAAPLAVWASLAMAGPAAMQTVGRTTQPVGHYQFCLELPDECRQVTEARQPVELTRALWAAVVEINNSVNMTVFPATDLEMWGREELWSYPDVVGDCEDYVLEKRRRLMQIGVPAGSLLITVVRQQNGDGHAVLTMRTDLGDFILDNLEPRILAWSDTGYEFLKRQSEQNSGIWVAIDDGRSLAVGSVR